MARQRIFVFDAANEVWLDDAAVRLGVNRMTIYNWIENGMPFDDHRKLPSFERRFVNAIGRNAIGRVILLKDVEGIERRRRQADLELVPAHEAQRLLNVCRGTLDNMRRRGELPGAVKKPVFRKNLLRTAWHYPKAALASAGQQRTSSSPGAETWRHTDERGAWMLGSQAHKDTSLSRRFLETYRNKKCPTGHFLHAKRIRNPRLNGKFKRVWVYLETDIIAIDSGLVADAADAVPQLAEAAARLSEIACPRWDDHAATLYWGGTPIREFRSNPAKNQRDIIEAFHRENWARTIPDPLNNSRKLNATIRDLNKSLASKLIRFRGDGTGEGVMWEPA